MIHIQSDKPSEQETIEILTENLSLAIDLIDDLHNDFINSGNEPDRDVLDFLASARRLIGVTA